MLLIHGMYLVGCFSTVITLKQSKELAGKNGILSSICTTDHITFYLSGPVEQFDGWLQSLVQQIVKPALVENDLAQMIDEVEKSISDCIFKIVIFDYFLILSNAQGFLWNII